MSRELTGAQMADIVALANRTVVREYRDLELTCTGGTVPRDLQGVLYRNGPGRFERGGQPYGHPFDGDGHIVRLAFDGGRVRYTNRFVRTRGLAAEEAAGRLVYRGFGTNLPGGVRTNAFCFKFKNPANTNILRHGPRLLALWEGGAPHRLDPDTLETLGIEDFDGRLRNRYSFLDRLLADELTFSAHPCTDPDSGDLYNFGILGGQRYRLMLYRVAADGTMDEPRVHPLRRFTFVHSFQLTRRYLVFPLPHTDFRTLPVLLGLATLGGSLRLATERPLELLLIPRDGGPPLVLEAGPGFVFHFAQGFDLDDGRLALDLVHYPDYPPLDRPDAVYGPAGAAIRPLLQRLTVDPATGACHMRPLSPCRAELPGTAPGGGWAPRRYIYCIGAPEDRALPYLSCILRVDTQTGETLRHEFVPDLPGEPVLVPDGAGELGWVLTLVYRAEARRTDLVILRSEDLGTVATVPLPQAVPPGFHGSWAQG